MAEEDLRSALENVERNGDVSASDDPRSASMRARIEREHLARRDEDGMLVLTSTGRQLLSARHASNARPGGVVTPFRRPIRPRG